MLTECRLLMQHSPAAPLGESPHCLSQPQLCPSAQLTSAALRSAAELTHCTLLHPSLSAPVPSLPTAWLPLPVSPQQQVPVPAPPRHAAAQLLLLPAQCTGCGNAAHRLPRSSTGPGCRSALQPLCSPLNTRRVPCTAVCVSQPVRRLLLLPGGSPGRVSG